MSDAVKSEPKVEELLLFDESTLKAKEYWFQKLSNVKSVTNIRLDYPRPNRYTTPPVTDTLDINLSGEVYRKLAQLTDSESFLVYAVLMTGINICLYKYTGETSIVVSSPVLKTGDDSSRFQNAVIIINEIDEGLSFRELLVNVRQNLLEAYEHQDYPFGHLVRDLGIEGVNNKCPLFDIALMLGDIHSEMPPVMNDITLRFDMEPGRINGRAVFLANLFKVETIERFTRHLSIILEAALDNIDTQIPGLQILSEGERYQILVEWNATQADYPRDKCNHRLFEDHVERTPTAAALGFANQELSYRELDQRANRVAHYLCSLGVKPDNIVGLCTNRSFEMIIGLLGILKARAAYVPLDPTYPRERLGAMLEDARLQVLLTKEHLLDRLPEHKAKTVCLDKDWDIIAPESPVVPVERASVHNLAYVIFTSGSTGKPKGAAVYHRGWTNLMHWFNTEFKVTSADHVLVISSFSFDITQRSIAMPLIAGGELHLLASDFYDPALILQTIAGKKISLMNCSPSTFYPLIERKELAGVEKLKSLRVLFLGGEAISASRLQSWAESGECVTVIANVYGAAECTDVSSYYCLKDYKRYIASSVPIGKPIFNTQVYILDKNLEPVPVGIAGEICIAGDGVGKGYINDEALTGAKFIANPFTDEPGAILYKTGDLGRFYPDGNIEFIGRVDYQVKVRGLRIDLGDIETLLRQHPAVKDAVVIDRVSTSGDKLLVGYIVPLQEQAPARSSAGADRAAPVDNTLPAKLREFLEKKLPPYMVPGFYVMLKELPLSPNGKVDREALPTPELSGTTAERVIDLPNTLLESDLVKIFTEVLKVEQIGINENFFEVGGHSLLVTQIIARINEVYRLKLSQVDFLVAPTVAGLATRIESIAKP